MSLWRKTIADLDFSIPVGAYGGPPGLRGQDLFASAKIAGWRDVFARANAPKVSYFYIEQLNVTRTDVAEGEGSWDAECVLHPVDPTLTPSRAKKIAREYGPNARRAISAFVTTSVDGARRGQAASDAWHAKILATEPWLLDHNYAGEYETAMWAHDPSGRYGDFPVKIPSSYYPPHLPVLFVLRPPEGWPRTHVFLTDPPGTPPPSFDGPVVPVLVYEVLKGENSPAASAIVVRGEREPLCELLVGSRDRIRDLSHD